jgi:tetratricopeptide (TPR) repeat protein
MAKPSQPSQPSRRPSRGGGGVDRTRGRLPRPTEAGTRTREQAVYDGPPLDDSITGKELDRAVAGQLRGLPDRLAARVARHLVAAGLLMDSDPETAYQHALAARARAARVAVVREACGEAAYAAGEYADALSELRAAKRMNGSADYLAVMADCERALGRPDRALSLARDPALARADDAVRVEMTIVEAGARRDLGQLDAALRTLEGAPLRSRSRADWGARLRYAYADTLLAAGRPADAVEWFHRTVAVDGAEITDAADRVAELEDSDGEPG